MGGQAWRRYCKDSGETRYHGTNKNERPKLPPYEASGNFNRNYGVLSFYFFHYIRFEDIAYADIVELIKSYTAFVSRCNLAHVILETAE